MIDFSLLYSANKLGLTWYVKRTCWWLTRSHSVVKGLILQRELPQRDPLGVVPLQQRVGFDVPDGARQALSGN